MACALRPMKASRAFLPLAAVLLGVVACADDTPTETIAFAPATVSGEIPCEVDTLLAVCRNCHANPTKNGAPFPIVKLGDVRGTYIGKSVSSRAASAITSKFMPQAPNDKDLTEDQRKFLISWFEMGAPSGAGCK